MNLGKYMYMKIFIKCKTLTLFRNIFMIRDILYDFILKLSRWIKRYLYFMIHKILNIIGVFEFLSLFIKLKNQINFSLVSSDPTQNCMGHENQVHRGIFSTGTGTFLRHTTLLFKTLSRYSE